MNDRQLTVVKGKNARKKKQANGNIREVPGASFDKMRDSNTKMNKQKCILSH